MSLDGHKGSQHNRKTGNRRLLKGLLGLSLVSSVLPTLLVSIGKTRTVIEIYAAISIYTITLILFGYLFFTNYENKVIREMKALVKKEGIISGELVLINTEEKLKNILSLELERCNHQNVESSILFFDIDRLGEINRKYGYNTGDQIIIEIILSTKRYIAESEVLQNTGAIIARVKGDTFALLMPNITEKSAYNEADKLKFIIENLRLGIEESITCRFAVLAISQWLSEDKFLDLAYEKLNLAKDYGKGVIV